MVTTFNHIWQGGDFTKWNVWVSFLIRVPTFRAAYIELILEFGGV
jgi:hypothetical protein